MSVIGLSVSPVTAGSAARATQGTLSCHWSWRGGAGKDQISYTQLSVCAKGPQASKLQMGNSLRRVLIREGYKTLIPDQIGHVQGFVSMGFGCYWYSDQVSPVESQPSAASGISNIPNLLSEDWQKACHNLNLILKQVNPLLCVFQLCLQLHSCHLCMLHSQGPSPSSVLCFRGCFSALQKAEPGFHFVLCILKTKLSVRSWL